MSDTPTIREMHGLSDKPRTFDQVAITVADPGYHPQLVIR